jgi:iron complex transport system ATP-binding protein
VRDPEGGADPTVPGLTASHLVAGYGGDPVLRGVSLRAGAGEVVGLIGPNGSGKTTLIRVASRGLQPTAGEVRLNGVDPYAVPNRRVAQLAAVVPQELATVFTFTVFEVVLMGRSPYLRSWSAGTAADWAKARQAMAATNVQHLADRPLDELSGGERQRAVMAQALAQGAPILLLDEPTTHMDPRHMLEAMLVVKRLVHEDGAAVLAVFHDLNLASTFCDRIHALADGRVVASGTPNDVITRDLLRGVYGVEADVTVAPATGRPAVTLAPLADARAPGSRRVHVIGGAGSAAPVLRALVERGFDVSVGVLHASDTDEEVAERLYLVRATIPAFAVIDGAAEAECRTLIRAAWAVVMCDPPFGPGNVPNLRLAVEALRAGVATYVVGGAPMAGRDFTGGEASRLMADLVAGARFVGSAAQVVDAVTSAAAAAG